MKIVKIRNFLWLATAFYLTLLMVPVQSKNVRSRRNDREHTNRRLHHELRRSKQRRTGNTYLPVSSSEPTNATTSRKTTINKLEENNDSSMVTKAPTFPSDPTSRTKISKERQTMKPDTSDTKIAEAILKTDQPSENLTNLTTPQQQTSLPAKSHKLKPNQHQFKKVSIKEGKVKGRIIELKSGVKVISFLGIPYGKTPDKENRFKAPKPVDSLGNKTKEAFHYGNSCYQWTDNSFEHYKKGFRGTAMWNTNTPKSEDCLYLNVWTTRTKKSSNMAVMVWIYGGGFYSGTSSLDVYDGKWLAAYHEVVVVSLNYRVGALGFLAAGDDRIPGNAGLLDQQLALKWVKRNIHAFGGDPKRVTLFGESSGSASISLHLLSEGSKGLFKNVILQSASYLGPWTVFDKEESMRRAKQLAKKLDCPKSNNTKNTISKAKGNMKNKLTEDEISCVLSAEPQVLMDTEMNAEGYGIARFPGGAVVDGKFLKFSPHSERSEERWNTEVNVLGGFNANEGNYFIVYSTIPGYSLANESTIDNESFKSGIKELLSTINNKRNRNNRIIDILAQSSHFVYTAGYRPMFNAEANESIAVPRGTRNLLHNNKLQQEPALQAKTYYRDRFDDMIGDVNFVCPTIAFLDKFLARQQALNDSDSKAYLYKFVHRSSQNPWPEWMGVMHGYEIEFVFGLPLNNSLNYTSLERNISKSIMKMWTNFAKYGNPNGKEEQIAWPAYTDEKKNIFIIGEQGEKINTNSSLYASKYSHQLTHCSFWRDHLPSLQKQLDVLQSPRPCPNMSGTWNGAGSHGIQTWFVLFLSVLVKLFL